MAMIPNSSCHCRRCCRERLPQEHRCYFISDNVDELDMSGITTRNEQESRSGPPSHPLMMINVLLYDCCIGVSSSRRIAHRLHEDIALIVRLVRRRCGAGYILP